MNGWETFDFLSVVLYSPLINSVLNVYELNNSELGGNSSKISLLLITYYYYESLSNSFIFMLLLGDF